MSFLKKIYAAKAMNKVKVSKDDEFIYFTIENRAKLIVVEESVSDDFPFGPYDGEDFYDDITDHDFVINIQHLEIKPEFRRQGYAKLLMEKGLAYIKKKYPSVPIYINASPLEFSIELNDLVKFYKSHGFKVLKTYPQHRNALLWKDHA